MDPAAPARPHPWSAAREQGRADIAAGRVSDVEPFLRALEAEDAAERGSRQISEDAASLGE